MGCASTPHMTSQTNPLLEWELHCPLALSIVPLLMPLPFVFYKTQLSEMSIFFESKRREKQTCPLVSFSPCCVHGKGGRNPSKVCTLKKRPIYLLPSSS